MPGTGKRRPRRNNQGPKVFAKHIKYQEDLTKALAMRKAGLGVREVAAHIGRSTGWVSQAVTKAIEDLPLENAKVYRAHVVGREEGIISAHWTKRGLPEHAKVIQASDKLLVDVLGLAAASRTEITLARELDTFLEKMKAALPPDVYEQVLGVLAGEHGAAPPPRDPTDEGGEH